MDEETLSRRLRTNSDTPRCSGSVAARRGRPTLGTDDERIDGVSSSDGSDSYQVYYGAVIITGTFQNHSTHATAFRRDVEVNLVHMAGSMRCEGGMS